MIKPINCLVNLLVVSDSAVPVHNLHPSDFRNPAAMAVRWPGITASQVLLLLACLSISAHGRIVPDLASLPRRSVGEFQRGVELDEADFDGVIVWMSKSSSTIVGEISTRIGGTDSDQQIGNHVVSVVQGPKWTRALGEIAEWVFHVCVVVLALCVIFYTISCVCACCIGLDILAEIWRLLGGWQGFSYFVRFEQAVVETEPESLPLVRSAAEP